MYCPECKEEFDGKFCPECGAKLIEKPKDDTGGFSLNLGDANAISGGINLHDSHDVHNIDNSVHNITTNNSTVNNITNIAAQKSEIEIIQERKVGFLNIVNMVLQGGHIDSEGLRFLEQERLKIGIDQETATNLINQAKKNAAPLVHDLSPMQQMMVNQIKVFVKENNCEQLQKQLPRLDALSKNSDDDEVQYLYSMVSAALHPHRLIEVLENSKVDSYWMCFWGFIAYLKIGDNHKAENILFKLSLFKQYPEENMVLLSGVEAYREFGAEAAKDLLSSVSGSYSENLGDFASALFLLTDPDFAEILGANGEQLEFYLKNLLEFVDEETQRQNMEAEASKLYNLSLDNPGSNTFKITMILKAGLNLSLAEAKALLECCPINIIKSQSKDKIEDMAVKLSQAGAKITINEL